MSACEVVKEDEAEMNKTRAYVQKCISRQRSIKRRISYIDLPHRKSTSAGRQSLSSLPSLRYLQSFPFIFPNQRPPIPPPSAAPFSKSLISVSEILPPFCCCCTSGAPGGPAFRLPATTPDRLRRSTSLRGRGPTARPVSRREARLMLSRTRHCRFLARMKRVMLSTIKHGRLVHMYVDREGRWGKGKTYHRRPQRTRRPRSQRSSRLERG